MKQPQFWGGLLLSLPLMGCGDQSRSEHVQPTIECAIGAGTEWSGDCPVERDGDIVTVRHADGGFRRFRIIQNGHSLMPADGAEESSSRRVDGDRIELSIGQDRYRLPARWIEALK
ncbi:hypothetical protein [Sphingobium estronivorans]|uniref:hypothetical protein n=1 Tax=Sphingobium estronivorans TaxID=1577690 RepID=UPI00123BF87D|nr:hypothetical protein [Sphingobium estronivorans]